MDSIPKVKHDYHCDVAAAFLSCSTGGFGNAFYSHVWQ